MARIRTIKPDFFLDDDIASLQPLTRLFYIGLWCLADREGRLDDKPTKIHVQILPYDKINPDSELTILAQRGFIVRYTVQTHDYIQILSFTKHQRIHHTEIDSVIPPLNNGDVTVRQPLDHGEPPPKNYSNPPVIREGKGREGRRVKTLLTDDEWIEQLKNNPAYAGLDIIKIKGKCEAWCDNNQKNFTRARLLNWLNREDKPLTPGGGNGRGKSSIPAFPSPASDTFCRCPRCNREILKADLDGDGCLKCQEPTDAGRKAFKAVMEAAQKGAL